MRHPEEFEGKHLLILDDVCTTGSTLTAASEAVSAGAPTATLSLLTLACVF
jgi:predicted amidophosphoribosyltransferase